MPNAAGRPKRCARGLGLALALWLALGPALAQDAGEVEFAGGAGLAQSPGEAPRILGRGLPLREGDRLSTAGDGVAVLRLADGTRMSLRPGSELVLQQFRYLDATRDNGLLLQLVRGGLRVVTGLLSKGSPGAVRIQTRYAILGIFGTDFDARLCGTDCAADSARASGPARPHPPRASARLVAGSGEISALDPGGQRRRLADGGPVYPGDTVETADAAHGMLAFRDESRVALGANTRFRVDNFVYDAANAAEGRFLASLLRGAVRILTGWIAKADHRHVGFSTTTATIGVRGTGFDMACTGACAGEPGNGPDAGLGLFTWRGAIEVGIPGEAVPWLLPAGQGLFISPAGLRPLDQPLPLDAPDPEGVPVPPALFGGPLAPEGAQGLYVAVREGHVELVTATGVLELGRGEAGWAGPGGELGRPAQVPRFLDADSVALPEARHLLLGRLLSEAGIPPNDMCR